MSERKPLTDDEVRAAFDAGWIDEDACAAALGLQGKYDIGPAAEAVRRAQDSVLDIIRERQDLRCVACGWIRSRLENEQLADPGMRGVCFNGKCRALLVPERDWSPPRSYWNRRW